MRSFVDAALIVLVERRAAAQADCTSRSVGLALLVCGSLVYGQDAGASLFSELNPNALANFRAISWRCPSVNFCWITPS